MLSSVLDGVCNPMPLSLSKSDLPGIQNMAGRCKLNENLT